MVEDTDGTSNGKVQFNPDIIVCRVHYEVLASGIKSVIYQKLISNKCVEMVLPHCHLLMAKSRNYPRSNLWRGYQGLFDAELWSRHINQINTAKEAVDAVIWYLEWLSENPLTFKAMQNFKLYRLVFSHYFDCPDIQKHKFCNFVADGDA